MNKDELKIILDDHKKWLNDEGGKRADLRRAVLRGADLSGADLRDADLRGADLRGADLSGADLSGAYLSGAYLSGADLRGADLRRAVLRRADLSGAKGMLKLMGVLPGNLYYKRFNGNLINNGYHFKVGLNVLRDGEEFASDERVLCAYPGFHFASKSWCDVNYGERPLEALIKIPTKEEYPNIQINEPWATDGKASANAIIIVQVWDTATGEDVTDQYR